MAKKNEKKTPKSQIKSALHKLFLRSRERSYALKTGKYTCSCCSAKQSRAKGSEIFVEIHHMDGIDWTKVYDFIYEQLLPDPERLQILCSDCHGEIHTKEARDGCQNHSTPV